MYVFHTLSLSYLKPQLCLGHGCEQILDFYQPIAFIPSKWSSPKFHSISRRYFFSNTALPLTSLSSEIAMVWVTTSHSLDKKQNLSTWPCLKFPMLSVGWPLLEHSWALPAPCLQTDCCGHRCLWQSILCSFHLMTWQYSHHHRKDN